MMSETILRVLAGELLTLRVTCGSCKAVVEIAVERRAYNGAFSAANACPLCAAAWRRSSTDALRSIVLALEELRQGGDGPAVEFVVKPPA